MEHENIEGNVIPADKAKIKNIWKVTAILGAITLLEFIIALGFPGAGGHFKN